MTDILNIHSETIFYTPITTLPPIQFHSPAIYQSNPLFTVSAFDFHELEEAELGFVEAGDYGADTVAGRDDFFIRQRA